MLPISMVNELSVANEIRNNLLISKYDIHSHELFYIIPDNQRHRGPILFYWNKLVTPFLSYTVFSFFFFFLYVGILELGSLD